MFCTARCATTLATLLAACMPVAAQTVDSPAASTILAVNVAIGPLTGCQTLSASGLGSLLLYPTDAAYAAREASYWAVNSQLGPQCIIQPRNTDDVSRVIKVLAKHGIQFAVRSGGHSQWSGGSDIHNGVTVDLGLMTNVTYDPQTQLVSIEPGPRWRDVYAALEPYNVGVTGGRDADVGIGGFLTGGGNSYYVGRTGFGCDTVVNFEVVLSNGDIVNANKSSHSDLWKALKGGSGNFGIVTRFDVESFPSKLLWGGMSIHNKTAGSQLATAMVNFNNNNHNNRDNAHLFLETYNSFVPGDTVIASVIVDTQGVVNASAFTEIQQIPAISRDLKTRSIGEITNTYVTPGGSRIVWFTLTFNNDVAIINEALALHDQVVADLTESMTATGFATQSIFQPIPAYFAQNSVHQGGNVLGLDSVKTNSIIWLGSVAYPDKAHDQVVHNRVSEWTASIESYARSRNGHVSWRYVNYADSTQDPLKSYGAANFDFIRKVAAKYDPSAVFQRQVPSGFKISRA
ncbi:hypothetical protein F5884DRAFT_881399 [Xylogone sp. PMI_703]|nr:hypothetical protein F5884DRAFT_881399 [Xylogone sp. PMI_703]